MTDDAEFGRRVIEALARGRKRRAEDEAPRIAELEREIRRELDMDLLNGHAAWGRAGRIAGRLRMKRRTVAKYLARLYRRANSLAQHDDETETGERI